MKGTAKYGDLVKIPKCNITIQGEVIDMFILPDISDSKGASYNDETIIGRSFPVKTYSHSDNRSISIEIHFIALRKEHIQRNLHWLRLLESATYPRDGTGGAPYTPPPICKIECGKILGDGGICAVLKNYSVKFPTDQVWDSDTLLPYKFDVSTTWDTVYASSSLPGQEMIAQNGS